MMREKKPRTEKEIKGGLTYVEKKKKGKQNSAHFISYQEKWR